MVQNLTSEAAIQAAVEKFKLQEERERQKLTDMPQKEFAELCNDMGVINGSRKQKVEELLVRMMKYGGRR